MSKLESEYLDKMADDFYENEPRENDDNWKCANCNLIKEEYEAQYCDSCWEVELAKMEFEKTLFELNKAIENLSKSNKEKLEIINKTGEFLSEIITKCK